MEYAIGILFGMGITTLQSEMVFTTGDKATYVLAVSKIDSIQCIDKEKLPHIILDKEENKITVRCMVK